MGEDWIRPSMVHSSSPFPHLLRPCEIERPVCFLSLSVYREDGEVGMDVNAASQAFFNLYNQVSSTQELIPGHWIGSACLCFPQFMRNGRRPIMCVWIYFPCSGHLPFQNRHHRVSPSPSRSHHRSSMCWSSRRIPSRVTPRGGGTSSAIRS
jgi:hypothetical protein